MDNTQKDVAATLLLPDRKPAGFVTGLGAWVAEELAALGHDIREVATTGRHLVRMEIAGAQIIAAYCGAPVTPAEYRHYLRPEGRDRFADEAAMAQLSVHRACIILSAKSRPTLEGFPPPTREEIETLVHQIIARIGNEIRVSLVMWARNGHLYTASEFGEMVAHAASVRPTLPARRVLADEARTPRPVLYIPTRGAAAAATVAADADADTDTVAPAANDNAAAPAAERGLFEQQVMDIVSLHSRLDETLSRVRHGAPHIRTWAPPDGFGRRRHVAGEDPSMPPPEVRANAPEPVANALPDLPPAAIGDAAAIRAALYPEGRPDRIDPRAQPLAHRITIYTLNTTLLVIALPVGAAMLTYNALGRESLSATARAMAITGVGLFYAKLPIAQQLLSAIL